jgi:hypothetical protein
MVNRGAPNSHGRARVFAPMAEAFGASVQVSAGGRGLFYVRGRTRSPSALVQGVGGQIVVHLPDPRRVLAILPLESHADLQRQPEIAVAGQVAVDADRFAGFARLVGLDEPP